MRRSAGSLGLRQEHDPQNGGDADCAERRRHPRRRRAGDPGPADPAGRLRVPEGHAFSVAHGRRQYRLCPGTRRRAGRGTARPGRSGDPPGRPRRFCPPLSVVAVRRPSPARRGGAAADPAARALAGRGIRQRAQRMRRLSTIAWQIAIGLAALAIWQWGWQLHDTLPWLVPDLLDPYFVSRPSDIYQQFLRMGCLVSSDSQWTWGESGAFARCIGKSDNNLWIATYYTLKNTLWGFAIGLRSGVALCLLLRRLDQLRMYLTPRFNAFNSVPRIALAPIIILAFGIGDASKVLTAWLAVG